MSAPPSPPISFSVGATGVVDGRELADLATKAEELGFGSLRVADHIGVTASPFGVLSYAAAVTSRLRLAPYVVNAGIWEPLQLARETATLDALSGGRAILGIGAGHTPVEWTMRALRRPPAPERVKRMIELTDCTVRLLSGESVTHRGDHVDLVDATLERPRPVQEKIPLLVGGGNPRLLQYALDHADIVAITGLGATLEDGHRHEVRWGADDLAPLRRRIASCDRRPVIDALVQHVELTNDATAAAEQVASRCPGASPADVLAVPFTLIGTEEDLIAEIRHHVDTMGITSFCVPAASIDDVTPIVAALAAETP